LLGIDGMHDEPTIKENIDHGTMRHFDRHRDGTRYAGPRKDPVGELGKTLTAMREFSLPNDGTLGIEQAGLVPLRSPVDTGKPSDPLLDHSILPDTAHGPP